MIRTLKISAAVAIAGAFSVAQGATTCTDTPKQYGPISVQKAGSKCVAVIDADGPNHNDPVVITETETVDSVYYYRSNSAHSAKQTIVLPVSPTGGCKPTTYGANLGKITKIAKNSDSKWTIFYDNFKTSDVGFSANTPYILNFTIREGKGPLFLAMSRCEFELNSTEDINSIAYPANPDPKSPTGLNGTWTFKGTYEKIVFDESSKKNAYGFVSQKDTINGKIFSVGQFVKAGTGTSVPPLRAYLVYNSNGVLAKAAPGLSFAPAADLLPASIEVIEEGECFQEGDGIFEVKMINDKKVACIDGKSDARLQTLSIPEDVTVDSIVYNREFTPQKATTVMFPFSFLQSNVTSSVFYKAISLVKYCDNCEWTLNLGSLPMTDTVEANKPYIAWTGSTNLTFNTTRYVENLGYVSSVTLSTEGAHSYNFNSFSIFAGDTIKANWSFVGSYSHIIFDESSKKGVYGFAANSQGDNITAGQFVKAGTGASVPPMRAYLKYNAAGALAKGAASTGIAEEDLPETIVVKFLNTDGEVTAIGQMNTTTGEISMDENKWFDMKGRMMNKKPTVKGTYYNKGQKVIIK